MLFSLPQIYWNTEHGTRDGIIKLPDKGLVNFQHQKENEFIGLFPGPSVRKMSKHHLDLRFCDDFKFRTDTVTA